MKKIEAIKSELLTGKYNVSNLERILGIPNKTISHFLTGRRELPVKFVDKLFLELKLNDNE